MGIVDMGAGAGRQGGGGGNCPPTFCLNEMDMPKF